VASQEGVVRLNADTGAYQSYRSGTGSSSRSGELLNNSIGRIYTDRAGILWASAGGFGVSRFDPTAMGFGKGEARANDPNSMRGEVVWNVTPDKDGVLWVAAFGSESSEPGWYINRIDRRTGKAQHWRTTVNENTPIVINRRGEVLIGSRPNRDTPESGGVLTYDPNRKTLVQRYTMANGFLPIDGIRRMMEASDGQLWVGTFRGLARINQETGEHTTWLRDPADPSKLISDSIWDLFEDSRGNVWVSTFGDLVRFAPGSDTFVRLWDHKDAPADWKSVLIRTMNEDLDGHLWLSVQLSGAPSRLVRYDPENDKMTTYSHDRSNRASWSGGQTAGIHPHPTDPDLIYFLSYGAGMSRLRVSTGEFKHYGSAEGLLDPAVYTGIWDDEQTLWVPTNSGLFRYDPENDSFRRFGMEYGLQSLEFNEGVVARSESNELFFGGVQGFNAFFPSQLRSNDVAPDVAITEFLLFNERVMPGPDSPLSTSIVNTKSIKLRHDQNAPTFQFAALHYKRPESNQIRYRLEPQEKDWIEANGRTEAAYTNLSPGTYTFRVIAANSDGVWNEEGSSVELIILSPWWAKWWAYLIYVGLLGVLVFGVDRIQRRRLVRQEREANRERELEQAKEMEAAYNQLRDTKQQLVEQEKLASLGSLTAGIAHEIKNPLNFVNNFAEVGAELAEELSEAITKGDAETAQSILKEMTENATQIAKHGRRADSIVRSMMQHAKGGVSEREKIDVNTFIEEYANLAWHGMRARENGFQAEVKRDLGADVGTTTVLPQELGRVLLNLFNNAYYAVMMPGASSKPTVTVSTRRHDDVIEIKVSDNGPGIPEAIRDKIFEPFFTTKPTGEGTGLGLSLSYDIITQGHKGTMRVEKAPEGGAMFVIELPA
jgi:signal transduction histidine kinase